MLVAGGTNKHQFPLYVELQNQYMKKVDYLSC